MKGNSQSLGTKLVILLLIYYFLYIETRRLLPSSATHCLKRFAKLWNTRSISPRFHFAVSSRIACFKLLYCVWEITVHCVLILSSNSINRIPVAMSSRVGIGHGTHNTLQSCSSLINTLYAPPIHCHWTYFEMAWHHIFFHFADCPLRLPIPHVGKNVFWNVFVGSAPP
jgi:hypothetical protein